MNRDTPLILVVDDNVQVREWMRTILDVKGYRVLEAGDGNEALAQYALHQPELVVIDIYMPGRDGLETIMLIRKQHRTVKILAISGNFYKGYTVDAMAEALGATGMLQKPFNTKELLDRVETLLKRADRNGN
jgi:two-component system KDP operon response regulator KdpE